MDGLGHYGTFSVFFWTESKTVGGSEKPRRSEILQEKQDSGYDRRGPDRKDLHRVGGLFLVIVDVADFHGVKGSSIAPELVLGNFRFFRGGSRAGHHRSTLSRGHPHVGDEIKTPQPRVESSIVNRA